MTLKFLFDYIRSPKSWHSLGEFSKGLEDYLSNPENNVDDKTPYGETLLITAIRMGLAPMVNILLSQGAYVDETVLLIAADKITIFQSLLEHFIKDFPQHKHACLNRVLRSLNIEHQPTLEWLLEKGADINAKNSEGQTALMLAVDKESFKLVKLLLRYQADVNLQDNHGNTALLYAASNPRTSIEMIQLLLQYKGSLKITNRLYQNPLLAAAKAGLNKAIILFLQHEPLDTSNFIGYRALYQALSNRRMKVVNTLIQYGFPLKLMPLGLTYNLKNQVFTFFSQALRIMPFNSFLSRPKILRHNLSMENYAKKSAKAIALHTPFSYPLAHIVNTYLFRDPVLMKIYEQKLAKNGLTLNRIHAKKRSQPTFSLSQESYKKRRI